MNIPTYKDKLFIVEDNDTRLRRADDLSRFEVYQNGDALPPGTQIGDFKRIPRRTSVQVTDTRTDAARTVFVRVEPTDAALGLPSGWTKAANLEGRFLNEITGWSPADMQAPPMGNNFTVTDHNALIREGAPNFKATSGSIPFGSFVVVTEESAGNPPAKFLRVSRATIANGQASAAEELGWTAASNLTAGCSQAFGSAAWSDHKGPNACWQGGNYLGAKLLVNIVGAGSEMEQITFESLVPYLRLRDAAAESHLELSVESGFRTFQKQAELFRLFQAGRGNLAAEPGKSNHQHGQAFDLNTHGFDADPLYAWLKKNAPRLGFIRTVNKEHWHWEYLPDMAATLAQQGKFATARVQK